MPVCLTGFRKTPSHRLRRQGRPWTGAGEGLVGVGLGLGRAEQGASWPPGDPPEPDLSAPSAVPVFRLRWARRARKPAALEGFFEAARWRCRE